MGLFKDLLGPLITGVAAFVAGVSPLGAVALAGLQFGAQKYQEREARSQLRKLREQGQRYNVRANDEPLPVIYGHVAVASGAIAWQVAHGHPNQPTVVGSTMWLSTVICWSEGEIEEVMTLSLNDIPAADSRFDGLVIPIHYTGSDSQSADPWLVSVSASPANPDLAGMWTVDHRLRGVAYSVVTLAYSQGAFGANGIPTITAQVKGRKCYDPRSEDTVYTANPALCLLDFLRNTRYGADVPDEEIDFESFRSAASYCDEKVYSLSNRPARYEFNGIIDPTDDVSEAVSQILSSCRGSLVYSGGQYRIKLDRPWADTPFVLQDQANLTGPWGVQMDSLGARVNRMRASFVNEAKNSQPDFVIVDDPAYRVTDYNELLEQEIMLYGVTRDGQAYDLAVWALRASRYSLIVEVTGTLQCLRVEVGDVVSLYHETPGWESKLFRVVAMTLLVTDEVRMTLREYSVTVYSDQTANADIPPGTTLPNPMFVAAPTSLTLSSVRVLQQSGYLYGIDVTWLMPQVTYVTGYQVEWRKTAETQWTHAVIGRADNMAHEIRGLEKLTDYTVRVRAVNSIGAVSDWVTDSEETLSDDPTDIDVPPDNELIPDPSITDPALWNLSTNPQPAIWLPTGGPDGGAAIRMPGGTVGACSAIRGAYTLRTIGGAQGYLPQYAYKDWAVHATDNQFQFWVVVRRRTTSATIGRLVIDVRSGFVNTGLSNTVDGVFDMSALPQNQWRTIGPYTIGPHSDPWTNDGNVHRMSVRLLNWYTGDPNNPTYGGVWEIASIRMIKVPT